MRSPVTHPDLIAALAITGHGSRILIADSHFASAQYLDSHSRIIFANYAPDSLTTIAALEPLLELVSIEHAYVTIPDDGPTQWTTEVDAILPVPSEPVRGSHFVDIVRTQKPELVIITSEQQAAACILLTLGT